MATRPYTIPTLKELNKMTAGDVSLLILRCLATSDLTAMYMLLERSTVKDLKQNLNGLIQDELTSDDRSSASYITLAELGEIEGYNEDLDVFANG